MSTNRYVEKIDEVLEELEYYSNIVVKKDASRDENALKLKALFEKNRDADEVKDFAFDALFIASFQNLDLQIIRAKFINYVELYLADEEALPLSDKAMEAYNYLKTKLPKRMFLAKDGNLVEINEGSVAKKKEMYIEQNLFEMVEQQVTQLMENVSKSR